MNAADLFAAIALPASVRVDQRVPKKHLLENGAPTAADKRQINEGVEELYWLAALKPSTVGVPEYRDELREYVEIAVLRLTLRPKAKTARLTELVHRAIPYPVFLLVEDGEAASLSLAHKRWSQGEAGKTVLDGDTIEAGFAAEEDTFGNEFKAALLLASQPRGTLHALYQGWIDTVLALNAARITGVFDPAKAPNERREALGECIRLEAEIDRLRAAAKKENQLPRQVELNLEVKRLEAAFDAARSKL